LVPFISPCEDRARKEVAVLSEEIRAEIRPRLEAAFRNCLQGVLLFGSEAQNQAGDDSDVDLMVLLKGPVRLGGRDLESIVNAFYPLQLKVDRPIHALPVSSEAFEEGRYGIHRSAKREGTYL
jgi:predicted nucleotidyltransferase